MSLYKNQKTIQQSLDRMVIEFGKLSVEAKRFRNALMVIRDNPNVDPRSIAKVVLAKK